MTDVLKLVASKPAIKNGECPIRAFGEVQNFCALIQAQRQIGTLIGPTGSGKTTSAKAFARDNENAFYMRLTTTTNTEQPFLVKLCSSIGCYVSPNSGKADLFYAVAKHLRSDWQRRLVIVDEFNYATAELVHLVRGLWDEEKCGIALIGTPDMECLWSERAGRRGGKGDVFAAFRDRAGQRHSISKPNQADVDAICRDLLGLTDKRTRDKIAEQVCGRGGLHYLEQLQINARAIAGAGTPVTAEHLRFACSLTSRGIS